MMKVKQVIMATLLVFGLAGFAQQQAPVQVVPGGVVKWSGEGTDSCGMSGKVWLPYEDTCFYPVDLEQRPGYVEVARWVNGAIELSWIDVTEAPYELQDITLPDDTYVNLSRENADRVWSEFRKLRRIWAKEGPIQFTLPLGQPLNPPLEGKYFGAPRIFNGQPRDPHKGADYAAGMGTPVLSVGKGETVLTEELFHPGTSVFVDHGNGLVSMYFHLSEIGVELSSAVDRGQTVGQVGSNGRSTGPHLHLGIRWHGWVIDPKWLIEAFDQIPDVVPVRN